MQPAEPIQPAARHLLEWLGSLGIQPQEVTALPGDVSPRRYFRVQRAEATPVIAALYPASQSTEVERFLATSRFFEAAGIRVPQILAATPQAGLMLLEDLGTVSVFDLLDSPWPDLRLHVESAMQTLASLSDTSGTLLAGINPDLDADRLSSELEDAWQVFLGSPEFSGESSEREALHSALDALIKSLRTEPLVPSHRDFMSRNLMLSPDGRELAVIDHQDACLAPRYYDLASLLNDSLFLSGSQEQDLLEQLTPKPGSLLPYRRCAVQRTLKATATYVKFATKGFDRHLPLVAPTLARAALQLEQLPEGADLPRSVLDRWRDPEAVDSSVARLLESDPESPQPSEC